MLTYVGSSGLVIFLARYSKLDIVVNLNKITRTLREAVVYSEISRERQVPVICTFFHFFKLRCQTADPNMFEIGGALATVGCHMTLCWSALSGAICTC